MRTIGLLGGMSWESTALYYRLLNEGVRDRLGGLHSARLVMHSVDFADLESAMRDDDWDDLSERMILAARSVESGGAECLLICTNTGHRVAGRIADAVGIPVIDLIEVVGNRAAALGLDRIGLLGTAYTMEQDFYISGLARRGVTAVVPGPEQRAEVNRVIFDELVVGVFDPHSRQALAAIVDSLGQPAVALACTELEMLLSDDDVACRLLPSTNLHVQAALDWALA